MDGYCVHVGGCTYTWMIVCTPGWMCTQCVHTYHCVHPNGYVYTSGWLCVKKDQERRLKWYGHTL